MGFVASSQSITCTLHPILRITGGFLVESHPRWISRLRARNEFVRHRLRRHDRRRPWTRARSRHAERDRRRQGDGRVTIAIGNRDDRRERRVRLHLADPRYVHHQRATLGLRRRGATGSHDHRGPSAVDRADTGQDQRDDRPHHESPELELGEVGRDGRRVLGQRGRRGSRASDRRCGFDQPSLQRDGLGARRELADGATRLEPGRVRARRRLRRRGLRTRRHPGATRIGRCTDHDAHQPRPR